MEKILNNFKKDHGILIGVCDASRMDYLLPLLEAAQTPFVSRSLEQRIDPRAVMANAESVIVIGVGYSPLSPPSGDVPRGRLAAIAAGDYHEKVTGLLTALAKRMRQKQNFGYRVFTDAGFLNERALAARAGLGFIGQNGHVISEAFGSFFNIGYMLTDLRLTPNERIIPSACGDCGRCACACIGGALRNGAVDAHKCVSYLTQRKRPPSPDEARTMSNWLYGCDICQEVCPFNAHVPRAKGFHPALSDCVSISDEDFNRLYGGSALFWRGAEVFRRNARIAAK